MSDYVALHDQLDAKVRASAAAVAPVVVAAVRPTSVLDVGCGNGTWLAAFAAAGATDILGMDGDYIDRTRLDIPADRFRPTDLSRPFDAGRRFDLAVCLEVGEHLPEAAAQPLVTALVAHAPVVLFSAAVPGQGGVDHIHERWPSYWAGLFRAAGCVPVDLVRRRFWADETVLYWYAQNVLLYVKEDALSRYPVLAAADGGMPLDVVHPRLHEALAREVGYARRPSVGSLVRALPAAAGRAVRSRLGASHPKNPSP